MVLMNATKRARNVSSTIANADNRCNGGMKKAGAPPYAGWMRSLNGVKKNYYFSRTSKNSKYMGNGPGKVTCTKNSKDYYFLPYKPVMPTPFRVEHRTKGQYHA